MTKSKRNTKSAAQGKRARGGQPGNKNAQKHGFYSAILSKSEADRLTAFKEADITDELILLRTIAHRVASLLRTIELTDDKMKAVNTLSNVVSVINTSTRTMLLARGGGGEVAKMILEAMMELDPHKEL